MPTHSLHSLRAQAIERSLFAPTTLRKAVAKLGFVQADPIRCPARAQDLILRQRVKGYRAGDLERRYPELGLEEDMLYAYGFATASIGQLLQRQKPEGITDFEAEILAAVRERGETHPRDLDEQFGAGRVTNPWGGTSKASKRSLERLHQRGLLRIARREKGIRLYAPVAERGEPLSVEERFRELVKVAVSIFAPAARSRLAAVLAPVRRRNDIDGKRARAIIDGLVDSGELEAVTIDGVCYVLPAGRAPRSTSRESVHILAPFDPLIWDRQRFEHFWGWCYKFEAYTPKAKRVRGYYAMPLLWRDEVIGWANISGEADEIDVELGFVHKRPRSRDFRNELEAEVERMRAFLRPRP